MPVTQEHLDRAVAIARQYGADRVLLFGSALHHPETARDLDIAVGGVDGWEFFGMAAEMENELKIPLDVISLTPENAFIRHIIGKGRLIYESR